MKKVELTKEARDALNQPIKGKGGYQQLLKKLRGQREKMSLSYDDLDLEKIQRYTTKYGQGGFQNGRLAPILSCIKNADTHSKNH